MTCDWRWIAFSNEKSIKIVFAETDVRELTQKKKVYEHANAHDHATKYSLRWRGLKTDRWRKKNCHVNRVTERNCRNSNENVQKIFCFFSFWRRIDHIENSFDHIAPTNRIIHVSKKIHVIIKIGQLDVPSTLLSLNSAKMKKEKNGGRKNIPRESLHAAGIIRFECIARFIRLFMVHLIRFRWNVLNGERQQQKNLYFHFDQYASR